jgi:hypothetical protein
MQSKEQPKGPTNRRNSVNGSEPNSHQLVDHTFWCPWSILGRCLHDPLNAIVLRHELVWKPVSRMTYTHVLGHLLSKVCKIPLQATLLSDG